MDLLDEPGVSDAEINYALQEAMSVVGAKVRGLYEDYFLKRGTLDLVSGTADVSYPTDCFANKVRALVYRSGNRIFRIPRLKAMEQYLEAECSAALAIWSPETAKFVPMDTAMKLIPTPAESGTGVLVCWYIRDLVAMTSDSDSCDIPEWEHAVVVYAKDVIAQNKPGLADPSKTSAKVDAIFTLMESDLSNRSPDDDDFVPSDTSTYEEHS
jgi:hypothetical protein